MNWIERLQKDFRMVSRMRWPCLTRNQSEKKSYLRSTLEINIDRNILQDEVSVVFQKECLGRSFQTLQICKYSDSWFQNNTPRRVVLIFVL